VIRHPPTRRHVNRDGPSPVRAWSISMVAARDEDKRLGASVGATYMQRYNVATSRAKDQLWLFHSITIGDVPNSEDLRHQLFDYCHGVISRREPTPQSAARTAVPDDMRVDPFDSLFEQRVYNRLIDRGLNVEPQYDAAGYRIDLVVIGGHYRRASAIWNVAAGRSSGSGNPSSTSIRTPCCSDSGNRSTRWTPPLPSISSRRRPQLPTNHPRSATI
jgi:hypothetical protein